MAAAGVGGSTTGVMVATSCWHLGAAISSACVRVARLRSVRFGWPESSRWGCPRHIVPVHGLQKRKRGRMRIAVVVVASCGRRWSLDQRSVEKPARDGRLPGTVEPGGAGGARAGKRTPPTNAPVEWMGRAEYLRHMFHVEPDGNP